MVTPVASTVKSATSTPATVSLKVTSNVTLVACVGLASARVIDAVGFPVSISTCSADEAPLTFPATSSAVAVMLCSPS